MIVEHIVNYKDRLTSIINNNNKKKLCNWVTKIKYGKPQEITINKYKNKLYLFKGTEHQKDSSTFNQSKYICIIQFDRSPIRLSEPIISYSQKNWITASKKIKNKIIGKESPTYLSIKNHTSPTQNP